MNNSDKKNSKIILTSGRVLGYAQYGDPGGKPVFFFHGGNGSRLEAGWFAECANQLEIRLIAPDRPGFGLSDFQLDRSILNWPADLVELADALNIDRFAIFGLSGGGPYVAACAHTISDRLTRAAIVSGTAPPDAPERFNGMWLPVRIIFELAKHSEPLLRVALAQMSKFYADEEQMRKRMLQAMPQPDIDLIQRRPDILKIFAEDAQESHRQGLDGDVYEWQLYVRDWGFRIQEIAMEIALWYGANDRQVPPSMGAYYAQTLPNNIYHLVPDGGHFSTINNYIGEILGYLIS